MRSPFNTYLFVWVFSADGNYSIQMRNSVINPFHLSTKKSFAIIHKVDASKNSKEFSTVVGKVMIILRGGGEFR